MGQRDLSLSLTIRYNAENTFMKNIHRNMTVRMVAAMLVTVAVIVLSSLATHAPAQNQSWLTLNRIRTDNASSVLR